MEKVKVLLSHSEEERIFSEDGSSADFSLQKNTSLSSTAAALMPEEGRLAVQLWTALLMSIFVILPILGMIQCPTWNGAISMVEGCKVIDTAFFRSYASHYYFLLMMFYQTGGILLAAYVGLLWISHKLGKMAIRWHYTRRRRRSSRLLMQAIHSRDSSLGEFAQV